MTLTFSLSAIPVDATRTPRVYFASESGRLHEFAFVGNAWRDRCLTPLPMHAWEKIEAIAATGAFDKSLARVYYVSDDNHVRELARRIGRWRLTDLTPMRNGPEINGKIAALGMGFGAEPRLYYNAVDGHIHELAFRSNAWHDLDLNSVVPAPDSASGTVAIGFEPPSDLRVYRSAFGHIGELTFSGGAWSERDLTTELNASHSSGVMTSIGTGPGYDPRVYIRTSTGHLHELAYWGNGWHRTDLTTRLQLPCAKGPLAATSVMPGMTTTHVYYIAGGSIHELSPAGQNWRDINLTAQLNLPLAAGGLSATKAMPTSEVRVYYDTINLHIHQLAFQGNTWNVLDLTPGSQAILAVPLIPQETDMWCWAASGQMIMTYLRHPVPQCEQACARFGRTDCCNSPVPRDCVHGGLPEFEKWGFTSQQVQRALTFAELQAEINAYRPIAFSWGWWGDSSGHMMVARGFDTANASVYINDPWPPFGGDVDWITHSDYDSQTYDHTHWNDYYMIRYVGPAGGDPGMETPVDGEPERLPTQARFPDARMAAENALKLFGTLVNAETAKEMGFEDLPVDPARLSLGESLPLYVVGQDTLLNYNVKQDAADALTDTHQRLFPVLDRGKLVSSVTVAEREGEWRFVRLGSRNLTRDVVEARAASMRETERKPEDYSLVTIPSLYLAFVAHRGEGERLLLTHTHDNADYELRRHVTSPAETVLAQVRDAFRRRFGDREQSGGVPF